MQRKRVNNLIWIIILDLDYLQLSHLMYTLLYLPILAQWTRCWVLSRRTLVRFVLSPTGVTGGTRKGITHQKTPTLHVGTHGPSLAGSARGLTASYQFTIVPQNVHTKYFLQNKTTVMLPCYT